MPPAGEARGDPRRSAVGGVEAAAATALPRRGVDRVLGGISNPSTQKPTRGVLWGEDGDGSTARSKKRTPATTNFVTAHRTRHDDDGNPCVSNFSTLVVIALVALDRARRLFAAERTQGP